MKKYLQGNIKLQQGNRRYKKNQMEILEPKNKKLKKENTPWTSSAAEQREGSVNLILQLQKLANLNNRKQTENNRASGTFETITNDLTFTTLQFQKEDEEGRG